MRIALGLLLLLDLGIRSVWLEAHYSDSGCTPRSELIQRNWAAPLWSLLVATGSWQLQAVLFVVQALTYLALAVGYRTRWTGPLSWIFIVSMQNRNPLILDGGDLYLRCLVFWLLFTPWGSVWSWDARRNPQQTVRACPPLAGFAYTWQLTLIYASAYFLKSGQPWIDGSAAAQALRVDQLATPLAGYLLQYPALLKVMTHAVLYFEGLAALLFWIHPWTRILAVLGLTSMHLGLGLFLHLGVFAPIAAVSTWGLLPAAFWRKPLQVEPAVPQSMATQIVTLFLLARITQCNVSVYQGYDSAPQPHDLRLLRLDQSWNMFAPRPQTEDAYFVVVGETADGERVDAWLRGDGVIRWEKPAHAAAYFPDARWRKLMMNLNENRHAAWREQLLRYLGQRWNRLHPDKPVRALTLYSVVETTTATGQESDHLQLHKLGYCSVTPVSTDEDQVSRSGLELVQVFQKASPKARK